jgi:hypothetical protein
MRDSGISIVGGTPWGTHLCQFYRTNAQLLEILVPYFQAGLEANEQCLWITSEDLPSEEAWAAMHEAMSPFLRRRLYSGQLEILEYSQWYLAGGTFDPPRVLAGWRDKLNAALSHGFEGLRAAGSAAGIRKSDWARCVQYEEAIDSRIEGHRILGLCAYRLDRCGEQEVIDVTRTHRLALFPQEGGWRLV